MGMSVLLQYCPLVYSSLYYPVHNPSVHVTPVLVVYYRYMTGQFQKRRSIPLM
jgi:hypothetical protein